MVCSSRLGVTPPISNEEPTDDDIALSHDLLQTIDKLNVYEDNEGIAKRDKLLSYIASLVQKWVFSTAVKQGKTAKSYGATAIAFGGHMLRVVTKESDIDVVCIVPSFTERATFFTTFVELLKTEAGHALTSIRLVTGARVPIIEICLHNIKVDLCLACLKIDDIPDDVDLSDDTLLKDMGLTDVRSLNGVREIRSTLQLVPDVKSYHDTLKAIKLWAKVSGLHHSAMGYPGGMAWAIMVARVCQLYPNAAPTTLMHKFFKIYSEWKWPTPVILIAQNRSDPYKLKPWNPKVNPGDKHHYMPIITPAYPEKNCASSVTKSALQLVVQLLQMALNLLKKIESSESAWKDLFTPLDFFSMYKHFLMLVARADEPAEHLDWSGLVQARSRQLMEDVERQTSIQLVHAYPKAYHEGCTTKWFWGLEFTSSRGIKLNIADDLHLFQENLTELAKERGFYKLGMFIECHHIKKKDLGSVLPS